MLLEVRLYKTYNKAAAGTVADLVTEYDPSFKEEYWKENDNLPLKSHDNYRHVDKGHGLLFEIDDLKVDEFAERLRDVMKANDILGDRVREYVDSLEDYHPPKVEINLSL